MAESLTETLSETEFVSRFKQAVAFYDRQLKIKPKAERLVLAEEAAQAAQLPVFGDKQKFYEILMDYQSSASAFAANMLRYVWQAYCAHEAR